MKTENTLENKAKFFALYWGQYIMVDPTIGKRIFPVTTGNIEYSINDPHLELKPLSSISDEDAITVSKLCTSNEDKNIENIKLWGRIYAMKSSIINDYLRSKGYALPWMGISVEQQVEWGWIKLKVE